MKWIHPEVVHTAMVYRMTAFWDMTGRFAPPAGARLSGPGLMAYIIKSVWKAGNGIPTCWPSAVLGPQSRGRYLLLSERAVEAFSREGITGLEDCQRVTILTAEGASHDVADAPNYYLADISGTIDLNGPAMSNLRKKNMCPACGKFRWSHQRLSPLRVDSASWNGKDLCRLTSIPGCVICTEKVRETVKKYRLTNFAFTELPDEGGQET